MAVVGATPTDQRSRRPQSTLPLSFVFVIHLVFLYVEPR